MLLALTRVLSCLVAQVSLHLTCQIPALLQLRDWDISYHITRDTFCNIFLSQARRLSHRGAASYAKLEGCVERVVSTVQLVLVVQASAELEVALWPITEWWAVNLWGRLNRPIESWLAGFAFEFVGFCRDGNASYAGYGQMCENVLTVELDWKNWGIDWI